MAYQPQYYVIGVYPDGTERTIHFDTNFAAVVKWRTGFLRKLARPKYYNRPDSVYIAHQFDGPVSIRVNPDDGQEYYVHNKRYVNVNATHRKKDWLS